MYTFFQVSLLITHYNRSSSLANLLYTLKDLKCGFGEIIVSDDGSNEEHLGKLHLLQKAFGFKLITTPVNRGLGHNINKGQDAVTKPYTLYIQEDFEPSAQFPHLFLQGLEHMKAKKALDIVRFYAYSPYAYLKPFDEHFSQMFHPTFGTDYTKIYLYSDHPHLRRSDFFQKFGRYPEGLKGDLTEYKMCISFLQNKAQGLFYNDFSKLLIQKNSQQEPSTMTRISWRESKAVWIKLLRDTYRQLKYNFDIIAQPPLRKL
ncbi:glycosyltransferase [Pedobacter sp. 22226]|uniref:glycosyltransferase n=1 Tax=Pedobacter sp. 22226 TaxID=3453894 RepID=UPI003F862F1D